MRPALSASRHTSFMMNLSGDEPAFDALRSEDIEAYRMKRVGLLVRFAVHASERTAGARIQQ